MRKSLFFPTRPEPSVPGLRTTAVVLAARPPADMMRWLCAPLVALAVLLMSIDLAEAKRMGGGSSFGSKDSYSKSYDKPTPPNKNMTTDRQTTPNQQAAPGGFMSKFGGIGGMLGGLLIGGMLGSLLFGGVGGGFGILEILLLGVAGFMLFRFIRSRRAAQAGQAAQMEQAAPAGGYRFAYAHAPAGGHDAGGSTDGWASVRSTPGGTGGSANIAPPVMPAGLDEAEFLAGAKALYSRLQASWDRRDLEDIRGFTSPEVFAEISRQAKEDPAPGKTDILMVEARVIEAGTQGSQTVISVLYDALLREDQTDTRSTQVREVWHIRRDESASNPQWTLEGIQQLAN
ncbi:Tim44 domain-containing protein [Fundidesulfovibrio soli]|uniref:Tim44 domain-containing protein n=1 Tax=Fundidesulfovibrio soli TaxID=2922716 RepID=UPI001FAEB697|nr:TIM44-like domain-containing protein [Fundidesulfovibrio soli]